MGVCIFVIPFCMVWIFHNNIWNILVKKIEKKTCEWSCGLHDLALALGWRLPCQMPTTPCLELGRVQLVQARWVCWPQSGRVAWGWCDSAPKWCGDRTLSQASIPIHLAGTISRLTSDPQGDLEQWESGISFPPQGLAAGAVLQGPGWDLKSELIPCSCGSIFASIKMESNFLISHIQSHLRAKHKGQLQVWQQPRKTRGPASGQGSWEAGQTGCFRRSQLGLCTWSGLDAASLSLGKWYST